MLALGCACGSDDEDVFLDTEAFEDETDGLGTGTGGGTFLTVGGNGEDEGGDADARSVIEGCDPQQVGSCGTDAKCTVIYEFDFDSDSRCAPLIGDDEVGEACELRVPDEGIDTCVEGSVCLTHQSAVFPSAPRCVAFCDEFEGCEPEGTTCTFAFGENLPVCLDPCDPLDPSSCEDPWVCHENRSDPRWYCAPRLDGQQGQHGSPCDPQELGLCAPGHVCMQNYAVDSEQCQDPGSDIGCCASLCDLDGAPRCPSDLEQCIQLYDAPSPGLENVGACVVVQSEG